MQQREGGCVMAAHPNRKQGADKTLSPLQQKLQRRLSNLKPAKSEAQRHQFREAFVVLEAFIAQGKSLKDVLAVFNEEAGANVCSRTFKEWLEAERKSRAEIGDVACCPTCGMPLTLDAPINTNDAPVNNDEGGSDE
ncbi:MAG: hypothetical protein QM769_04925 [Pseudoxanthomonas sp.]